MTPRNTLPLLLAIALLCACGEDKAKKAADDLLEKARQEYAEKQYDKALRSIDSLRKTFPQAIEARKAALKLHQDVALTQAQEELARTDQLLEKAKAEYASLKQAAEQAKQALKATPRQLEEVTLKKMALDSLQVRFDVQCAKIKYIHKRQKE